MTLRLRLVCGLVIALVGAGLAIVQIAGALHETHQANGAVTQVWAPANSASNKLLASLVDQETGERGFVITGDRKFLQPFTAAQQAVQADITQIGSLAGDDATVKASLAAVSAQYQEWLTKSAQPEIAARQAGNVAGADTLVDNENGQQLFQTLRSKVTALQSDVSTRTTAERARVTAGIAKLERGFLGTLIGAVVLAAMFLLLMQASVLRPLGKLQHRLRRATAGAFRDEITETGPSELREVARDAESMRQRLLQELESSESARQALEQRGPVVLGLSEQLRIGDLEPIAGLHIASVLHAAEGVVAGDLLDVVRIDDTRVGLVIADVSGHGAVAGLEAIAMKHTIGTALRLGHSPAEAFEAVADRLRLDERFATSAIVVLDVLTGRLDYANAGHLAPVIVPATAKVTQESLRSLHPTGPLLSVLGRGWDVVTTQLDPGELLLLVTDGLLEARSVKNEEFGMVGVCKALSGGNGRREVDAVVGLLTTAAKSYAHDYHRDDVTILAVMRDDVVVGQSGLPGRQTGGSIELREPAEDRSA
jgi:serine phosphatase RsbU (regulator of sigma subunit)/CHASE3 domain sensor protein